MRMRTILLTLGLGAAATAGFAAADQTVLDCDFVTTCDQDGACGPAGDLRVTFTLEPVEVGLHGDGTYVLRHDAVTAEMVQYSPFGPMVWTEGKSDVQTLSGTGHSTMIWQQMRITDGPTSVIHFLKCEEAR